MIHRAFGVLLAAVLCASPALGQEQRGSIEGTVRDNSNAVLPGASVESRNVTTGAVATTLSDSNGLFRFPSLLPGDYEVTATLQGFTPAKVPNVPVGVGQIKRVDFALNVGGVAETVQVTAEQPLIDVKQASNATNITGPFIDKIAKGRDFTSLVIQAPGVNNEPRLGGISVDGASAGENRFVIDGVETTDLVSGTSGKNFIVDFVDTVQVKTSGYSAEYGGSTGGVLNAITRSGANAFRGEAGVYFTSDELESSRRPSLRLVPTDSTRAEYITYAEDDYMRLDPGFQIGGPVLRDRLWFFGAYQPGITDTTRTVNFSTGDVLPFDQNTRVDYFAANLTAQLSNTMRGRFAVNGSSSTRDNLLPDLAGNQSPTALFGIDRKEPNYTYSGTFDYVPSDTLLFSVRGGHFSSDIRDEGVPNEIRYVFQASNIGLAGVPAQFQNVQNFSNLSTNSAVVRDQRPRTNLYADATYFGSFAGQHTLKGGLQLDRLGNNVSLGDQKNWVQLYWNLRLSSTLPTGPFGYYRIRSNGVDPSRGFITEGDISSNNLGLFIQDQWTIGQKLTLELGVRTENETIRSYTTAEGLPSEAIEFGFADKLAPRLGASYDLFGTGRTKLYGNYGVFYDITKLQLGRGSFGGDKWIDSFYTLDTADYTTLLRPGCPPACPGTFLRQTDFRHPSNENIDPDIEPMRIQKWSAGVEHQLTNAIGLSARYVHNQVDTAVEDIGSLDPQGNEIYVIGNPGLGLATQAFPGIPFPKAVRDYDALELVFNKLYADRWFARVSYTLSRLYGNYSGLSQSDESGRTSPNVGRLFDYSLMSFDQTGQPTLGRLATDRPHQFKAQIGYDLPWGTTVSLDQFVESGVPITREAAFLPPNNYPIQYLGRLSDGRTPVFSQSNMLLAHQFGLGNSKNLVAQVEILNLFDQDTALSVFQTELFSGQGLSVTEAQFYAGVDTQALIAAQNPRRDARFLQPNSFQIPRLIRFNVKFRF